MDDLIEILFNFQIFYNKYIVYVIYFMLYNSYKKWHHLFSGLVFLLLGSFFLTGLSLESCKILAKCLTIE